MEIKNICVFAGSECGINSSYTDAAKFLAAELVENDIGLVYGGGNIGLMGELANEMMERDGQVVGIIPKSLYDKEIAHEGITKLHVVKTMHERKALMADFSDAFIAMPGGIGTLEEIFEVWSWVRLGLHNKPCGFLNVSNYFDSLMAFVNHMVEQGFLAKKTFKTIFIEDSPKKIIRAFKKHDPLSTV